MLSFAKLLGNKIGSFADSEGDSMYGADISKCFTVVWTSPNCCCVALRESFMAKPFGRN